MIDPYTSLSPSLPLFLHRIQYVRHLHDRVHVLETRTAPPKEEETVADATAAAMGYGMPLMMQDTLMITAGPAGGYGGGAGYGGGGGYPGGGYAAQLPPGSIPDPYAQPQGYGYGGYY